MADFINTIDVLGDDAVIDSIINRTIPEYKDDTVTKVGQYAFYNCTALETVELPNVGTVEGNTFQNCTALREVVIPKVTILQGSVFVKCTALTDVVAPQATHIRSNTFADCKALKSIHLPMLTELGASGFTGCNMLETVDFPKLTAILTTAFYGCAALAKLILRNTAAVATLQGTNAFTGTPIASGTGYIYVPSALYDSYKAATNWSTYANQFRKLEEWTVDGTVTGELDTNRHMVRFFNSDGTLLGYKIVTTGGSATWDGDAPVDPAGENAFTGFEPEPVNVTADMDCYAKYADPYAEAWEAVFASIDAGTYATDYAIGDTVPLNLGSEGVINMQIAAFDSDDLADGSGKAHITWIAKELLKTTQQMGTGVYDTTGWQETEMRSYLKNTIKPMIPQTVRNAIVDVSKQSVTVQWMEYGTEDVWIPAYYNEIANGSAGWKYQSLFPDATSQIKSIVGETDSKYWWCRDFATNNSFYCARGNSRPATVGSSTYYGVCLCFCT